MSFWSSLSKQRRKRMILWLVASFFILLVLFLARRVLGLYLIGIILAYILAPMVDKLQKWLTDFGLRIRFKFLQKNARGISIIISYLVLIGIIAGFVSLVFPVISNEAKDLWERRDAIWAQIKRVADSAFEQYQLLPDTIRNQLDEMLANINTTLADAIQRIIEQAFEVTGFAITFTASIVLGITIVPFWTYFLLRDFPELKASVNQMIPSAVRADLRSMLHMLDRTIGAYLRGQILLSVTIGVLQFVVMSLLGLEYALLLGVIAGVLEIVPNIGPTIAAIPAILLALTRSPLLALITAVACNMIQNVENSFIVPRVMGRSLGLHPVVLMVLLVVGTEIAGFPGLVLAPILAAVSRDLYRYLGYRFAEEPLPPQQALEHVVLLGEFNQDL
ncbi:MAG: AI-2E family transporter [Anaerolineae bacterium]|nr:AI-2E family transporter [Anaerolineae bacterium]